VNSPDEARKAVRQRYKEGSDVIKITATGGVLSNAKDGAGAHFTEEEIKAVIQTAKDYGFKVAAHAHGAEGMKRAIRAGVTSIEHGTFMDDETIRLMKQYGTYYVPTITAGKSVADSAKIPGYFPPLVVPKAIETGPKIQSTFTKAYKAGVKIAFGTDAGVFAHGKNFKEFEYMVEAGMPAMETIKAATTFAADLLGLSDRIGTIDKGKLADIIAVEGNPIQDIKAMQQVIFVMKEGVVYKGPSKLVY
jgi:imidazolonepropionase-like amidohydrolase